jgi:glycerol uptake facilitator-like aquaporin
VNKYIVELIGTFFLVLTVGCTVISPGAGDLAPLAIGASLMVMIFAGGHISGGHYNPAVTLGVWMRGKCDTKDIVPYWVAQLIGALLAAVIVKFFKGGVTLTPSNPPVLAALLAEFLFTFALVYVVLHTATAKSHGRQFLLRLGYWYDGDDRGVRGRQYFWWCLQSGRGSWHFHHGVSGVDEHLDLLGCRTGRWRGCGGGL